MRSEMKHSHHHSSTSTSLTYGSMDTSLEIKQFSSHRTIIIQASAHQSNWVSCKNSILPFQYQPTTQGATPIPPFTRILQIQSKYSNSTSKFHILRTRYASTQSEHSSFILTHKIPFLICILSAIGFAYAPPPHLLDISSDLS